MLSLILKIGSGTESGEPTATTWKWFSLMDEAIGGWPSIQPPCLNALARGENPPVSASASPDSVPLEAETEPGPSKRCHFRVAPEGRMGGGQGGQTFEFVRNNYK